MPETLRIRPENSTVRELDIPKDKLETLQKILSSPKATDDIKKLMIKRLTGVSSCCICAGIPSLEVLYNCDGATKIERYCEPCSEKVFSRNAIL